MTGRTISHYKILDKVGEGGMGVVYKAEDERLERTVALKFLPKAAGSEEDRARFLREARAAAALDHPNICTIYEIGENDGQAFLAMAFLEGRTLDRRIEEGPLPLKEALDIARQAAEGLQAAHRKGIVHRDIKSSNLMLTGENPSRPQVKLLDFGLAQLAGQSKLTQTNSLLGTVAYMSPEQTQGERVDARTDVWSLGVVLYEMIAGELPFKGHYDQATMYSILNEEPEPLTGLRSRLPVELDWIVDKCLAKSPDQRYQSMEDLIVDLTTLDKKLDSQRLSIHRSQLAASGAAAAIARPPSAAPTLPALEPAAEPKRWRRLALALGALSAVLLLALLSSEDRAEPAAAVTAMGPVRRLEITLPPQLPQRAPQLRSLAIAPDGSRIAFSIGGEEPGRIWLRDLSQPAAYALEGTEGAGEVFWSPDSAWIGFTAGRTVQKIPAAGGLPQTLTELAQGVLEGASWSPDGESIVFTAGPPFRLLEVSARGGEPKTLLESPSGRRGFPDRPRILPGNKGRMLLYDTRSFSGSQIMIRDLDAEEAAPLADGEEPFFAPTSPEAGYILYRGGSMMSDVWALPYSPTRKKAMGEAFPIASGGARPSASSDGVLAYASDMRAGPLQLTWVDRQGRRQGKIGRAQPQLRSPTVSPDGTYVAAVSAEGGETDLWLHDAARNTARRLTTSAESEFLPRWSPQGDWLYFAAAGEKGPQFYRVDVARGGAPELVEIPEGAIPIDATRDGSRMLVRLRGPGRGGLALLVHNSAGEPEIEPLDAAGPGGGPPGGPGGGPSGGDARLSPDGRYLAYETREEDRSQVMVRDLTQGDRRWLASAEGGERPRWRADGRELYFVHGEALMAAPVHEGADPPVGAPEKLFEDPALGGGPRSSGYDAAPDGSRFVVAELPERPTPPTIKVVLNWRSAFEE
ncbi:MAG: protein kinase [Acidobacteria bacterium]|nr:protein kinase [Acidobacteriota bacterium]